MQNRRKFSIPHTNGQLSPSTTSNTLGFGKWKIIWFSRCNINTPPSEDVGNGSVTLPPSRRTSSPRILPTPPSPLQQFSPNSRGIQNSSNMNLSYNDENVGYQQPPPASPFERRRSVRRQLPPEPPNIQQYDSTPKLIIVNNNSSHQITKRQLSGETKSNKLKE
uniref:Uncharacterized protein n=1 Tax=Meloidogyne enterolobii TaxID=390850 RepID=A0A6V7VMP1_MELEN|nr:unnamed protein product [Meloidogyne enterolobii]